MTSRSMILVALIVFVIPTLVLTVLFYNYSHHLVQVEASALKLEPGVVITWLRDVELKSGNSTIALTVIVKTEVLRYRNGRYLVQAYLIDPHSGKVVRQALTVLPEGFYYLPESLLGKSGFVIDNNTYRLVGLEEVSTPMGMLKAYHYVVEKGGMRADFWFIAENGIMAKASIVMHGKNGELKEYVTLTRIGWASS